MIPVRLVLHESASTSQWRRVRDLEHGTLCRAFNLDPCSHSFDLPATAFGARVGDQSSRVSGYLLRAGAPVGTLHIAREGERFRDLDPTNRSDQMNLEQTR